MLVKIVFLLIWCAVVISSSSSYRKYPEKRRNVEDEKGGDNFVYIGGSKSKSKPAAEDNKTLRSAPYYSLIPMAIGSNKPSEYSYLPPSTHHQNNMGSLLNLNIQHLLEPFMLITFLIFVLCLLEKAKILAPLSRLDIEALPPHPLTEYEGYVNYIKRNSTASSSSDYQ